jgi:putative transcriptional regulator
MSLTPDLAAPVLLVAMPQILDPLFHKSVILLVHHDEQGSFGLILNRRSRQRLAHLLDELELDWQGDGDARVYIGGPVQPELGTVLFSQIEQSATDGSQEGLRGAIPVAAGQAITHHIDDLSRLAGQPPESMRLFLGYAGWGAGQLVAEISRNDWLTAPVRKELLYCESDATWERTLATVGVEPGSLPSWSPVPESFLAN